MTLGYSRGRFFAYLRALPASTVDAATPAKLEARVLTLLASRGLDATPEDLAWVDYDFGVNPIHA